MRLLDRKGMWYAAGMIAGELYRVSTGYRVQLGRRGREAAQRRLTEIELAIRSNAQGWQQPECPTFTDYWTLTYEPTYTKRKRAPQRDHQVMAHAVPFFGAMRLDEIKKSDCERYLNMRRNAPQANPTRKTFSTVAEGTVQRERSFLQAVLQQAVEDGYLTRNPWRGIARIEYAVRDRLVTEDEQRELLSRLAPTFQRFVLFLLATGVRLDECRGITPGTDLHFESRSVRVKGKFGKVRDVPLPAEIVPVLRQQLEVDGQLWTQTPHRLREVLARACEAREGAPARVSRRGHDVAAKRARHELPLITPHALRHTFGWRWLKGGGDIYTLSKVLGHASVAVTERHYAHLLKEDLQAKADAVDLGLGLPKPKEKPTKLLPWKRTRKA